MSARGFLFAGLLVMGCADRTQLVVVVGTDVATPSLMQEIEVVVNDKDGEEVGSELFDLAAESVPLSFGLEPRGDLKDEEVNIRVEGRDIARTLVIERRVITGFVPFERRLLQIFLASSCSTVSCPDDQTCEGTSCVSARVDVLNLPFFDPDLDVTVPR